MDIVSIIISVGAIGGIVFVLQERSKKHFEGLIEKQKIDISNTIEDLKKATIIQYEKNKPRFKQIEENILEVTTLIKESNELLMEKLNSSKTEDSQKTFDLILENQKELLEKLEQHEGDFKQLLESNSDIVVEMLEEIKKQNQDIDDKNHLDKAIAEFKIIKKEMSEG